MKANKIISITTAFLVFLVAVGSFALSYDALQDMATRNGIAGPLAYVWPLLIDFSLIVFSLAVVNAYLKSEAIWKQWTLVGIYTVATIGFNIAHAPTDFQARIVAAIAPISLFFSFEILMSQLRNSVKRSSLIESIDQLEQRLEQMRSKLRSRFDQERSSLRAKFEQLSKQLNAKRQELEQVEQELEQRRSTVAQLTEQIETLERSKKAAEIVQYDALNAHNEQVLTDKQAALNKLLNYLRSNPNATLNEAGEAIERSKGTVSNYLNELEQAGLIYRNGEGVKVL